MKALPVLAPFLASESGGGLVVLQRGWWCFKWLWQWDMVRDNVRKHVAEGMFQNAFGILYS